MIIGMRAATATTVTLMAMMRVMVGSSSEAALRAALLLVVVWGVLLLKGWVLPMASVLLSLKGVLSGGVVIAGIVIVWVALQIINSVGLISCIVIVPVKSLMLGDIAVTVGDMVVTVGDMVVTVIIELMSVIIKSAEHSMISPFTSSFASNTSSLPAP